MEPGIYSLSLKADNEPVGEAIVVLSDGTLHGGGPGYLCKGYYDDDTIRCELWAYRKDHATIFGQRDRYTLKLERGTLQAQELIFSGHSDGNPPSAISFEFVWQGPLLPVSNRST